MAEARFLLVLQPVPPDLAGFRAFNIAVQAVC